MKYSVKETVLTFGVITAFIASNIVLAAKIHPTKQIDTCNCTCSVPTFVGDPVKVEKISIQNRQCNVNEESDGSTCTMSDGTEGHKSNCKSSTGQAPTRLDSIRDGFQAPSTGGVFTDDTKDSSDYYNPNKFTR